MHRTILIALALPTLLAACAHPDIYDKNHGTEAQFRVDAGACKMVAMSAPAYTAEQIDIHTRTQAAAQIVADFAAAAATDQAQKSAFRSCMASRGYLLREADALPPSAGMLPASGVR